MKVCKFGGTSLATAEQIEKVCAIICADPDRRAVVVSAPGVRQNFKGEPKITDQLIQCAETHLAGGEAGPYMDEIIRRYQEIGAALGVSEATLREVARDFRSRLEVGGLSRSRYLDRMKAAGEDNCAKLVAEALRARGVRARYINPREAGLLLTDESGNAQVLPESYDNLHALRHTPGVVVFPGFFGATRSGEIVTFPRGGSDITGAILARAIGADLYENFTDVDGVRVVDPKIVPNAQIIRELTYREMRELSYTGFSVFNDEALAPVAEVGIPVRIRSTNNPDAPGTLIVERREYTPGQIVGIASRGGFSVLYVSKYLMNREVGFGRRLLRILEKENLAYEHAPSGIDNISVVIRDTGFDERVRQRVIQRIYDKLQADEVRVEHGHALVMVVGEGMRDTPGLAARATGALARAGINIEMMNQGSSEISMTFGVREVKRIAAVKALYWEFFPES